MTVVVRFEPGGESVRVAPGTTLLDATRQAGLPIASACGAGALCGRCGVTIVRGAESLAEETAEERRAKRANRVDEAARLACCVKLEHDLTVRASYW